MDSQLVKLSRFLSLVLRHQPQAAGVELDVEGWVDIDSLLTGMAAHNRPISRETLERVVHENDKGRFAFSEDGQRIRARQGHSVDIDLALEPLLPPETLFHGTPERFVEAILRDGLRKMQRHHVHLSATRETATAVGARRGSPVILVVDAGVMYRDGFAFYRSENGVWLTDHVPPRYLKV